MRLSMHHKIESKCKCLFFNILFFFMFFIFRAGSKSELLQDTRFFFIELNLEKLVRAHLIACKLVGEI